MGVSTPESRASVISRVDVWLTVFDFLYVSGTHEVPAGLSVQSTEHSFHDKSLAPECIWGEWIYTGIIDPPHSSSPSLPPRFDPFLAPWCIRACLSRLSLASLFRSSRLSPRLSSHRITTVPLCVCVRLSLSSTLRRHSFYNHQLLHRHFQRLWNHPGRPNPPPGRLSSKRNGERANGRTGGRERGRAGA